MKAVIAESGLYADDIEGGAAVLTTEAPGDGVVNLHIANGTDLIATVAMDRSEWGDVLVLINEAIAAAREES